MPEITKRKVQLHELIWWKEIIGTNPKDTLASELLGYTGYQVTVGSGERITQKPWK